MKKLSDTIISMVSENYKKNLIAEYEQLIIRKAELQQMLAKWDNGELDSIPCPRELYDIQIKAMSDYEKALVIRAKIEEIDITGDGFMGVILC